MLWGCTAKQFEDVRCRMFLVCVQFSCVLESAFPCTYAYCSSRVLCLYCVHELVTVFVFPSHGLLCYSSTVRELLATWHIVFMCRTVNFFIFNERLLKHPVSWQVLLLTLFIQWKSSSQCTRQACSGFLALQRVVPAATYSIAGSLKKALT
jgi:hypothetical protein